MEAAGMDETKTSDNHLTSAAAFVEGGIQDACDDACSICLEAFCDSDPSTVTSCKHEFHLQCILEWCQRSSQCPMCWQPISLKDPTSQELLEAVEHERKLRFTPPRNAAIFHHPAFGEFEFQNLPVGANDSELEERIIQHLAAAAMGRSHYMARREGHRNRSTSQGRPQFLVFSTNSNGSPTSPVSSSPDRGGLDNGPGRPTSANSSTPLPGGEPSQGISQLFPAQSEQSMASPSGSSIRASNQSRVSASTQNSAGQSSPVNQDSAGPSELQSLSESLKSRLTAVSTRYKESITKSTRGWKERLFSRNTSMSDISSEVKREVNAGIASVSRLMERLEAKENARVVGSSASNTIGDSVIEPDSQSNADIRASNPSNDRNNSPSCAARSGQD